MIDDFLVEGKTALGGRDIGMELMESWLRGNLSQKSWWKNMDGAERWKSKMIPKNKMGKTWLGWPEKKEKLKKKLKGCKKATKEERQKKKSRKALEKT